MKIFLFTTKLNIWNSIILNKLLSNEYISVHGIYFASPRGGDKGSIVKLKRLWNYGLFNLVKIGIQKLFYSASKQKTLIIQCRNKIIDQKIKTYSGNDFRFCLDTASEFADYSILLYFNRIIPKKYIRNNYQIINIHPGDLPNYRGVKPIFWALLKNEKEIKATIHSVDAGIDTGPIYRKIRIPIVSKSISNIMLSVSIEIAEIICSVLKEIDSGSLQSLSQNIEAGRYYARPSANDIKRFLKSGKRFF